MKETYSYIKIAEVLNKSAKFVRRAKKLIEYDEGFNSVSEKKEKLERKI